MKEVPAVGDLRRLGCALGQGLAVDVRAVPSGGLYLGVPPSQVTRPSCERSGSRSTTLRRSRSTSTVP